MEEPRAKSCFVAGAVLKRLSVFILVLLPLLMFGTSCGVAAGLFNANPPPEPPKPIPVTPSSGYSPSAQAPRLPKFTTTRPVSPGSAPNITLNLPPPNTEVSSPVHLEGRASVFEAALQLSVKDAQGKEIGKNMATASEGAPGWGDYKVNLSYALAGQKQEGVIHVFSLSAKDGSVQDLLEIPVILLPNR